jgi:hypothetical protein
MGKQFGEVWIWVGVFKFKRDLQIKARFYFRIATKDVDCVLEPFHAGQTMTLLRFLEPPLDKKSSTRQFSGFFRN